MAVTTFGVNDALANKLWSKKLAVEVSKATAIAPLIGTSTNSIIQLKDETQKGAGDQVTFGLRRQLVGAGVTEGQVLEGNEEALSTYSDAIRINELAHAVRVKNEQTIDAQRVPFSMREEANAGLVDWYADRMSLAAFIHWGGYTGTTMTFEGYNIPVIDGRYTGNNTPTAPTSGRQIWAGTATSDQTLGVSDVFTLNLIDKAVERAKLANPKIRPVRINGADHYVMYLHPTQVTSMRTNTSTGQWLDIQKAAERRGSDNPIFTGALGVYNNVILREAEHVVPGVNSSTGAEISTIRRAVLLGAQSAVAAFGNKTAPERYKRVEELFDYQRELGVSVQTIWGLKKTTFQGQQDFGVIVVSTYAAAA
jgi:N4-gp56 family major capsid protein